MNILIDNKDLETYFGITCLDHTETFGFASERENERTWHDKSGVDRNLENIKLDAKEFVLKCIVKDSDEGAAYLKIKVLVDYIFSIGVFVLSLRDTAKGIRECYLCERSSVIVPDINIRQQNSLYSFKLGLKDVNPNALKYKNTIAGNASSIAYTKGRWAVLYWGNGNRENIANSGTYTKSDYAADGLVDIIADIDQNVSDVVGLVADFSADITSGVQAQTVQFTDASTGGVVLWAWDFGDGSTSEEQNPEHIYTEAGTYTVTLQIFNSVNGSDTETKTDYIIIRSARMLVNVGGDFGIINSGGDFGLIN